MNLNNILDLSYQKSITDTEAFWSTVASNTLDWFSPWHTVLRHNYKEGLIKWFEGATLNVSHNCIDRHLIKQPDKTALIWEGDNPHESRRISYKELHREVSALALALKSIGVEKGDRIVIYMPMIPEAAFAMLACARIGAIHSIVFAGFSAESLRSRIEDCSAKMVITANLAKRGGKIIPLKQIVDKALETKSTIEHVLIFNRETNTQYPLCTVEERDLEASSLIAKFYDKRSEPEKLDAEHPLFILYTSGSTGKPKGVVHTTGGYLTYAAITHREVFDLKDNDIFFCTADIGWITGHSYVVYGPLANGATTVMFESTPLYPNPNRYWETIEKYNVSIFYTAPTAIRTLIKEAPESAKNFQMRSLRVLGSVGEPINPDAWQWYHSEVGKGRCPIVDTWWQTETGGILISSRASEYKNKDGSLVEQKPGAAATPFFGIKPCLLDEQGKEIFETEASGNLCISFPWPGQARTVYNDHQRFIETYFKMYPGYYFTGDGSHRDKDSEYWITGRVDDVLNVSGHRVGTAEVEGAIVHSGVVTEAAVVGKPHDTKGTSIFAFCILDEFHLGLHTSDEQNHSTITKDLIDKVKQSVRSQIGGFAVPDGILFVPGLPRTRSGKIMRRILRKIVENDIGAIGDTSTITDPSIVSVILGLYEKEFTN
jgi:acetyl-CoA synthetase